MPTGDRSLSLSGHLAQGIRDGPGRSISVLLALRDRRGYGQNLAYQDFAGLFLVRGPSPKGSDGWQVRGEGMELNSLLSNRGIGFTGR